MYGVLELCVPVAFTVCVPPSIVSPEKLVSTNISSPESPLRISASAPPLIVSFPLPPLILLASLLPLKISSPLLPIIFSIFEIVSVCDTVLEV